MPKSKRQTRKVSSNAAAEVVSTNGGKSAGSSSLYDRGFNPDYSQTIKDLKRIGLLAGSFIGILVILTFFLR
jgi:hypothetical protein